jgi:hypothetical protein
MKAGANGGDSISLYGVETAALLGIDLLRREPCGLADQMAYRALLLTESPSAAANLLSLPAPSSSEVEQARSNALLLGTDSTLDHLTANAIQGASPDALATLVVGTAQDAYAAILAFAGNSPPRPEVRILADGVLALWSHKLISEEDQLLLLTPARQYLEANPLRPEAVRFTPQTQPMRGLIQQVQQLTSQDFRRLEDSTAGTEEWEGAMLEASMATSTTGRCRTVASAQLSALAALGETASRLGVHLSALVPAATSLAGAAQAVMVCDLAPAAVLDSLLHDWDLTPSGARHQLAR